MSTTAELLKGAAELFPDEVVTQAHVRHLDLPFGAGRFALITLDNGFDHTKPTTFGPAVAGEPRRRDRPGREGGRGRRDRRRRHHRQAVHLRRRRRPQGRRAAEGARGRARHRQGRPRGLQAARRRSPCRPSRTTTARRWAAASRSVCTAPTAPSPQALPAFSLPEVFLGLVPGWGGCALLPNLIGADRAVSVIIENSLNQNKQLKGQQVFELGIADAIFEGADFLEQSLIWTAHVLKGEIEVERPEIDRGEAWDQAVATRPVHRRRQGARRGPGRLPRAGHHRRRQERRPAGRASTPRTRPSPT